MPRPRGNSKSGPRKRHTLNSEDEYSSATSATTSNSSPAKRTTRTDSRTRRGGTTFEDRDRGGRSGNGTASASSSRPTTNGFQSSLLKNYSSSDGIDSRLPPVPASIHSLPEELLIEIFHYLGHGDRKTARSANKHWCKVMSNWSGYNNNIIFVVKGGTESRSVLKETEVPWKKIRIEKFRLNEKGHGNFCLPRSLSNIVTSVEFSKSIVSWDGIQSVLTQFEALEEINIIQCKRKRKETLSPVPLRVTRGTQQFQENLVDILKKVSSVTLELRRISDMIFYLNQLNKHNVSGLVNVCLKDVYDGGETVSPNAVSDLLSALFTLIQNSERTLKTLRINFVTLSVMNAFFVEVVSKMRQLPIDLQIFEVSNLAKAPNNLRDLDIFSTFIQSQKNIMEIRLPKPGDIPVTYCRALIQLVSKSLRKVHFTTDKYMNYDFFEKFLKLRQIGCDFEMRPFLLSGKTYRNIKALEMHNGVLCSTIPLIVSSFPNLTKLNINGNSEDVPPMDDNGLQTIIRNLKQLQVIVLGSCGTVTDYGVTGISRIYCQKLFRSRAICLDPEMEVPKEEISGSPLSSLKGLTSLTFMGETLITDVGIYYGFGFQELRHLSLRNNNDISDWGLDVLGKLNSNLESLYMGFGPWVTKVGLQSLRGRLRKIKRGNAVYIWPHHEYYSSDESYAMESDDEEHYILA